MSFWTLDRNRGEFSRLSENMQEMIVDLSDVRKELVGHELYSSISSIDDIRIFMRYHVFAVWDFMCLLKAVQRNLTCVEFPWLPTADADIRRLVNDIVLSEETDEGFGGGYSSHFELYQLAMDGAGGPTEMVERFIELLRGKCGVLLAARRVGAPQGAINFLGSTLNIVKRNQVVEVASAFTFSREDVVPEMFQGILDRSGELKGQNLDAFRYYLDRHIAVDSEEHGPMAFEMIERLCKDNEESWHLARDAARLALGSRIRLWDACLAEIRAMDQAKFAPSTNEGKVASLRLSS